MVLVGEVKVVEMPQQELREDGGRQGQTRWSCNSAELVDYLAQSVPGERIKIIQLITGNLLPSDNNPSSTMKQTTNLFDQRQNVNLLL